MSAQQVREEFVALILDTAAHVDVDGWKVSRPAVTQDCEGDSFKFVFDYVAPEQPASRDRTADAAAVAAYWESLGMNPETKGQSDARVVYARGDVAGSIMFSTGPGLYAISATSRCVEGDREAIDQETYPAPTAEVTP